MRMDFSIVSENARMWEIQRDDHDEDWVSQEMGKQAVGKNGGLHDRVNGEYQLWLDLIKSMAISGEILRIS